MSFIEFGGFDGLDKKFKSLYLSEKNMRLVHKNIVPHRYNILWFNLSALLLLPPNGRNYLLFYCFRAE